MTETEILIIGGGIAGASTAYHLAQRAHGVTLLERGTIACEASGVNAGSIGAMGWGNVPDLEAYLTMGSLEIFKSLQLDLGYRIEFRQAGGLQAIHTEAQYAFTRDRVLHLHACGHCTPSLSWMRSRSTAPARVRTLCQAADHQGGARSRAGGNPALLGCMYMPLRAQADPKKATRAFAVAAERSGARMLAQHEVTAIHIHTGHRHPVLAEADPARCVTLLEAAPVAAYRNA